MADGFLKLAAAGVQNLRPYQPGKPIEALRREYTVDRVIKLASNENPLGPSMKAMEAAQRACQQAHYYPDGGGVKLREAIAAKYEHDGVTPAQVTLGNGSSELLEIVARAFVVAENEVIFSQYAFAMYPIVTQAIGAKAVVTKAYCWGHDLAAMAEAVTPNTRIVFIANPNNPTGTWCGARMLRAFLNYVPAHTLVVLDEAYAEYVEEPEYPDTLSWLPKYPNLIVTRTFSKIYGLAGLRVGYAISHPEVAEILNRVRQPFNVSHVAMDAAVAALRDDEHVIRSVLVNRKGMEYLRNACTKLRLGYIPSAANFMAIETGPRSQFIFEALLRQGIIVRPLVAYGMPHHLRVTVGLQEENEQFIAALQRAY